MSHKFQDLNCLLDQDKRAHQLYDTLPEYIQDTLCQRSKQINSYASLCDYVDNLTRQDD